MRIKAEAPSAAEATSARVHVIVWLALLAWIAAHLLWILSENVNWDEFALLARAHDTLRTGTLASGGRPGLATLVLIPFVEGCRDAVQAVRWSRVLWTVFATAILIGLWGVLRSLFEGRPTAARDAALGVALLALTPAFLRYSLQVRTDQPAIALGLLGGLALLHSRRRPALAVLTGLLMGTGYLFSQKLIYVAALMGLLALGDALLRRDIRWSRDAIRVVLAAAAVVGVVGVYRVLVSQFFDLPPRVQVSGQLNVFEFYRRTIGYRYYLQMTPELLVHIGLVSLLLARAPRALRAGGRDREIAFLVLAVLGLGVAVAWFHAGAFPYFWMTLGLFPAVAIAVGMPVLRAEVRPASRRRLGLAVWTGLVVTATYAGAALSRDTQGVQRDTLRLADRNFGGAAVGFQPERAVFCRGGDDPFPVYFTQNIVAAFTGPDGAEAAADFLGEFRSRPVEFIVESYRLDHFPEVVKDFWAEHYVLYSAVLLVPGITLHGSEVSETAMFDVIVPGEYRFWGSSEGAVITVDGVRLVDGASLTMDSGPHEVRAGKGTAGLLAISLLDPPGPPAERFYKPF